MKQIATAMLAVFAAVSTIAQDVPLVLKTSSQFFSLTPIASNAPLLQAADVIVGGDRIIAAVQLYAGAQVHDIKVAEVDISPPSYLEATLNNGKMVRIRWEDMGKDSALARESLKTRLVRLSQVLIHDTGKAHNAFDATDAKRIYAYNHDPTPPTVSADAPIYYQVQEDETLFSIAMLFGLSVEDLKRANQLESDMVKPGQKIRLPINRNRGHVLTNSIPANPKTE